MDENIRHFLTRICEKLKKADGSVEIVRTCGTGILYSEGNHWIDYGASSLEAIYDNAKSLISMIEQFQTYDDAPSQFIYDFLPVVEEFSFHASIFNVYLVSIERVLNTELNERWGELKIEGEDARDIDQYDENISNIALNWDLNIGLEEKKRILRELLINSIDVLQYYSLFSQINDEPRGQYLYLTRFYKAVLTLQYYWALILCRGEGTKGGFEPGQNQGKLQ